MIPTNDVPVRMAERPKARSWVTTTRPWLFCALDNIDIRPANQLFVPGRAQITAARSKTLNDVWSDMRILTESTRERKTGAVQIHLPPAAGAL